MLKDIADSRIEIDSCRLLCLQAASMMDSVGNKQAAQQIGMIKVLAPNMALRVIDRAIQAHGAKGVCQDTALPWMWAGARTLRLAGQCFHNCLLRAQRSVSRLHATFSDCSLCCAAVRIPLSFRWP